MGKSDEKKTGAGLLFSSGDEILLLLRNSKHNDKTWGLPGGNVEDGDSSLFETAKREATEELGPLPENLVPIWEVPVGFCVVSTGPSASEKLACTWQTTRGKHGHKSYAVFVCALDPEVKQNWSPTLNEEHREWR
eukprot:1196370-Prorocentrum_minimum.AAC.5